MLDAEKLLLRRFVDQDDPEALSEIVTQYAGLVYSACHRVLDDADKAADAAQETFLQLLRNAGRISESLPGWLHRAATRLAIDRLRTDASRWRRESRYAGDSQHEVRQWQDISASVDEALDGLDDPTRDILIRHFFQSQTMREIGAQLSVSQATVSRRVEAGVDQLRGKMRSRGMVFTVGTLSALLGEHAVQAAPAALLKELGKVALAGSHAALGTTGVPAGTGVLASVQAKIVAVAAVVVLALVSAVTYQEVTRTSEQETVVTEEDVIDLGPAEQVPRSMGIGGGLGGGMGMGGGSRMGTEVPPG